MSETKMQKAGEAVPAVAFQQEREKLLATMTDATRKVAEDCDRRFDLRHRGDTMTMYHIGSRMVDALDEAKQGEYGSNAAKQLAAYITDLDGDTNLLYGLRTWALTYDEPFVKEWAEKKIGRGKRLSMTHWLNLSAMADATERQKTFDAVVTHGLSANDIALRLRSGELKAKNVRAGGRKVSPPTSLLSGLEKLRSDMLKVDNYAKMCEKHVFGKLASMAMTEFTDTYVTKLEADKVTVAALRDRLSATDQHIDACLERAKSALAQKAEKAEKAEAKKPEAKKPQPAKAGKPAAAGGKAAKPAAKGGKAGKNGKPAQKVKAGRPTPATAAV